MRRRFEPIPDPAGALVPPPRYPRTAIAAATPPPPRRRSERVAAPRRARRVSRPRRLMAELLQSVASSAGSFARAATQLAERIATAR